jgi:hypothetical protein
MLLVQGNRIADGLDTLTDLSLAAVHHLANGFGAEAPLEHLDNPISLDCAFAVRSGRKRTITHSEGEKAVGYIQALTLFPFDLALSSWLSRPWNRKFGASPLPDLDRAVAPEIS